MTILPVPEVLSKGLVASWARTGAFQIQGMPTIKGADTEYRTVHPFTCSSSALD